MKKFKLNQPLVTLSVLAISLLASCHGKNEIYSPSSKESNTITVKTMKITKSVVSDTIHTSGQFTTDDETFLSFKTGGRVFKTFVKEGDKVRKGQLLASLDLTEINAMVNQAKVQFEKASRDHKRVQNLYRDSVVTLEQFQNAKTNLEIQEQNLTAMKYNLNYSEIRAQADGVILRKFVNEGQMVALGTPMFQVSCKGHAEWILRVPVSDKDWANISVKDKSYIKLEALKQYNLVGYVYSKSESVDPFSESFTVDIRVNGARDLNIGAGMFGKAVIVTSQKHNIWQVPFNAILDGNANKGFVFVTNDNKTALKIPVKIGAIENNYVEIVDGLSGSLNLVVSGSAYLKDKSSINILN